MSMTKRYISIGIVCATLPLMGCAPKPSPFGGMDLTQEKWRGNINTTSDGWTAGADKWFSTGEPNAAEQANIDAPNSEGIATMTVRVPDFTKIRVSGSFQTQIYGSSDHNSVSLFGPSIKMSEMMVSVQGDTLVVRQRPESTQDLSRLILRIGIVNLESLSQGGTGIVEAAQIHSGKLDINTHGCGNIYLSGKVNLQQVLKSSCGSVVVLGANTQKLDIKTSGTGVVNVRGNVGIRSIEHHGATSVNIVGANSKDLRINADGKGKVGLYGRVGLKEVTTNGSVGVYIYQIDTNHLNAYAYGSSQIGLSGRVSELNVYTANNARFEGRYLCTTNATVKSQDSSHINVTASNRIFASARQNSSIYFFGSKNVLSSFIQDQATVIPVGSDYARHCIGEYIPPSYKDEGIY